MVLYFRCEEKMKKIKIMSSVFTVAFLSALSAVMVVGNKVSAQEVDLSNPDAIAEYADLNDPLQNNLNNENVPSSNTMGQVTNVNQLRDVAPTDWAYEALRSLVDRYGCISGFPNQTYRGSQALTRYEFAAGLNSCLNQIERLIASNPGANESDIAKIQALSEEFEAELATLGGRVDEIESRTAVLEDSQFSTTTQLQGEVAFTIAEAFGDDIDTETVFTDRVRLQLISSFTGKDQLITRLTAGNIGNSFQDEIGTREGRFAFDGQVDNDITLDRLHYNFPVGEKLNVITMAGLAGHNFYADTFNSGLDVGGGANGALSAFAERNPIYRQGISTTSAGIGANYAFSDFLTISGGYIAPTATDPTVGNGLFNGSFSALGQIELTPIEPLKIGLTYVRGFDNEQAGLDEDGLPADFRGTFLFGTTGTNFGNFQGVGVVNQPVATNSFGAEFQFDINETFSVRGWGAYTDANIINPGDDNDGDGDVINFAGALVLTDLLKEGSLAALIVGAEPYLDSIDVDGDGNDEDIATDLPLHVEAFYKYQLNDNISLTPGVIWLANPNQDEDNADIFIGALRTTFSF